MNEQEAKTKRTHPANQTTDAGHPETLAILTRTADSISTHQEIQEENHHTTEAEEVEDEDSAEDHRDHPREDQGGRLTCHQRDLHWRDLHKVILPEVTPTHPTDFMEMHHKYSMEIAAR